MEDLGQVFVKDRRLRCLHCGGQQFHQKEAFLQSDGMWPHVPSIYVCARCGFAHFFMPVPEVERHFGKAVPPAREDGCLSCGKPIPSDATKCPACGWTWAAEEESSGS
jgi:DNA-directed RNA polymerase subunit RPC12/RpoP